jgi:hypothetical protein
MASDIEAVRRHLLSLASQEAKRLLDFPNDWKPHEVIDPRLENRTFTNESAWELIVALLDSEHPMRAVAQVNPPNSIAYEMVCCLDDGWNVYIKIRLGKRGRIFGRSFHYAER